MPSTRPKSNQEGGGWIARVGRRSFHCCPTLGRRFGQSLLLWIILKTNARIALAANMLFRKQMPMPGEKLRITGGPNPRLCLLILICCAILGGCDYVAVHTAPKKQATTQRTAAGVQADEVFWRVFHGGAFDEIPEALDTVTGAYLQDPADAVTAAHVAWLHMWRAAERSRLDRLAPTITDDLVAQHYFEQAVALNPGEARYQGFLAAARLFVGSVNRDERETRRGYHELLDSIAAWPEFNLFTAGYVMSREPADSARFQQGLEWQWRNVDVCAEAKVDRGHPDYAAYMSHPTTQGRKRACWNSWIAPHNLEGFFLNMGDMLVASGDWKTARIIYANARLSPTYAEWKYRDVLEQRIVNAQSNVAAFRAPPSGTTPDRDTPRLMIAGDFACMACRRQ